MADDLKQRKQDLVDIEAKMKAINDSQASYDKRFKDELKLKKKLQKELNALANKQAEIAKEIGITEKNNASNAVKELKLKKSVSDATKQQEKTEKDINKSVAGRLLDIIKLDFSSVIQKNNVKEQLTSTKKLQDATLNVTKQIQSGVDAEGDLNRFSLLNVDDKSKMIDLTKGLADGTYDVTDLQSTQNSLSEEGQKVMQDTLAVEQDSNNKTVAKSNVMKSIITAKQTEEEITKGVREEEEKIAKFKQIQQTLTVGTAAVFGALLAVANKFGATIDSIGKQFGSLSVMGEPFKNDLLDASVEATRLGGGIEDVAAITSTLASSFGMNVDEAAKLSSKVFDTSKAIGLSADEGANLFGVLTQTANLSADQAEKLAEGAFQLARQAGVAPSAVMADIAGSAEEIAGFTKDGGDNIAEAAVQARQMGLSLSTTAKISKGLLDFESSISNEIEASVMIGKQLNFQKARQLALDGDIAGATKNIVDQLGSEAEFNKLNVLQRESLAKSIGVSVGELSKMVSASDKLTLSGAMAGKSFGDLLGQDAISNISNIVNEFKALGATLVQELGPTIETLAGQFRNFITEGGGLETIKGIIVGIGKAFGFVATHLPTVIGLMVTLKGITIATTIAQAILAVTKATAATAYGFGFGGVIVAGLLAGLAVKAATSIPKKQTGGRATGTFMAGESGPELVNVGNNPANVFSAEQTRQLGGGDANFGKIESALERLVSINLAGNEQRGNQRIIGRRGELAIASEPQRGGLSMGIV
jgi:hypothetical protein